jgi:hypothetical protein
MQHLLSLLIINNATVGAYRLECYWIHTLGRSFLLDFAEELERRKNGGLKTTKAAAI